MSFNKTFSAVMKGDIKYVKRFFGRLPDRINHQDDGGRTPLYLAVCTGNMAMVDMLIKNGADVTVGDNDGTTPLHLACYMGHTATVKVLLEHSTADVSVVDKNGITPLYVACHNGHTDTVKVLLQLSTADVNVVDKDGSTPLHGACYNGHTDTVKVLLEQSTADVSVVNKNDGNTPLHLACYKGHTDTVNVLLEQSTINGNMGNKDSNTPLHLAVLWQHNDVVALMLSQGHQVQMEKKNSLQQTPFLLAVCEGDFELIHTLVSNGADINAVGADGNNCLHLALETKKFHSRGKYLDVLDEFCSTLGLSKEDSLSPKVVASYLAGQGADLYHTNQNNKTPLDLIGDPVFKEKLGFFSPQVKCMLCDENQATVNFHPCGHKVTCEECSKIKLKRCPQCREPITRKSGSESPSETELLPEQVAQHLRIESHQAESPQLEVREPTKAAKQVGAKWVQVDGKWKQVKSQNLVERDLMKVAKQVGAKWRQVGIFLGISNNELGIIRKDHQDDTVEQAFEMLLKWSQSCGPEKRTVDVLRDALQEADCYEAIKHLPSEEKRI